MTRTDTGISRDTALVVALASGLTPTEAAVQAGVSRRTAYRRLDEPVFRARVQAERDTVFRSALGRLTDASLVAVDTLRSIAADEEVPPSVRISSAKALLDSALRAREQVELAERLRAIEEHLNPPAVS